jgi:hypothetical protein
VIELHADHPPLGLWFIALNDKTDFMGCLQSVKDNPGNFRFDFRFRIHKDDQVFDSEDEKHWYHMQTKEPTTADEIIHSTREVILRLAEIQSHDGPKAPEVDELLWRDYNDWDQFIKAFQDKPYAYAKMVSQEEASKYTGAKP